MRLPARIVLASANQHKVTELSEVLQAAWPDQVQLLARPDWVSDVIEDAAEFVGNARKKAVALVDATGEHALADDSGLEVDGLGGAPGVRSARYAGEHADDEENRARLLADLIEVPELDDRRRARFRCVLVLASPTGEEVVAEGVVRGRIVTSARGVAGFGYDPLFVPDDGDGRTFAEMSPPEKHAISHRGRALAKLVAALSVP